MSSADPKIIELINAQKKEGNVLTSLEYFPPRTEEGVKVSLFFPEHCPYNNEWRHRTWTFGSYSDEHLVVRYLTQLNLQFEYVLYRIYMLVWIA